jgi:hypothetical protein
MSCIRYTPAFDGTLRAQPSRNGTVPSGCKDGGATTIVRRWEVKKQSEVQVISSPQRYIPNESTARVVRGGCASDFSLGPGLLDVAEERFDLSRNRNQRPVQVLTRQTSGDTPSASHYDASVAPQVFLVVKQLYVEGYSCPFGV